jgi:Tubulin like
MATNNAPVNNEARRMEAQKLSPTLIIGLGGTGGDVLLRIRKKFFEKFGGIDEFPIVSYLWFDTDKNYKDVGAKQFAKKMDFSNTEERLITIADTGSITSHLDQPVYANVASWWPTGLNVIPRLDDGAGQYRPYSRLGLYYHYARPETSIRQSIEDALGRIQSPAAIQKVMSSPKLRRLRYDAEIQSVGTSTRNVYVIGSLAGGTGSGLFIDIAKIVKSIDPDVIQVGFFLTSRFFPTPKPRMHANTYAALLEWDYYNDHDFLSNWRLNQLPGEKEKQSPLFNYSYILDTPNAAHLVLGVNPDDHKKVYEMVAENVFKDFSHGAFAQAKRSARVNVGQFMGTKWKYPPSQDPKEFRQSFNRHYQSFGLASISIPHDRIITACAHRLAANLVAFWKGEGSQDANVAAIEQDVRAFLPAADVQLDGNSILERLDDAGSNGIKASTSSSLLQKICRATDKILDEAKAVSAAERPHFLEDSIGRLRQEELNEAGRGQNSGITLRCIEQNAVKVVERGAKAIEQQCNRRIDEQKLSVVSTIMFAERVAEELEKAGRLIGDRVKMVREEVAHLENQYTERLNQMRTHALWRNFTFRKQIVLDYDMFRFREDVLGIGDTPEQMDNNPGVLLALRQKAVLEAAQKVYAALLEKLRGVQAESGEFRGGIISRLRQLERDFDIAADRLRQDAGYFEEKHNEDLSLVLFESEDIQSKYYPHCVQPESVKRLSDLLKDQYNLTAAAVKDTNFLKQEGASGRILDCCRDLFERIRSDFHVIDVLFEYFNAAEDRDGRPVVNDNMARELSRVFASSRFWAYGGANQMRNFQLERGQEEMHVGLPTVPTDAPDAERTRRRREAVKEFLATRVDSRFRFPDIPDTSEIIFYNDLSGVPLNFFESMYDLREAYRNLRVSDNALHLEAKESSKFEDVLILTDTEKARLRSAMSCIVLGSIYDQLWVKPEEKRVIFGFTEMVRAVEAHKRIGEEREAVNYLQQRADVTENLLGICRSRLEEAYQAAGSNDAKTQSDGRENLVRIGALLADRMQGLANSAVREDADGKPGTFTGDWTDLPLIKKMEYYACDQLDKDLHQRCRWEGFNDRVSQAKSRITDFAEQREDGRYRLKVATAAAARS